MCIFYCMLVLCTQVNTINTTNDKHLFLVGKYWIDPNGGVPNDAVLVLCDFEALSTCVLPKVSKVGPHN